IYTWFCCPVCLNVEGISSSTSTSCLNRTRHQHQTRSIIIIPSNCTMVSLHPLLDNGITPGTPSFSGGTLKCLCASSPVEVTLTSNVLHNHACGCSKCWKPAGALFSIVGVVPKDKLAVTANGDKLSIIDESAAIQRYACRECGTHLFGRIEKEHPFSGLDFVHAELSEDKGWQEPQFAAFVSSVIEQGFDPAKIGEVRERFKALGLETYDALSPPLMDAIATWTGKKNGKLPA
ncbi:putative glutathione-dependent formaldehyde-activating enzyme, partial [Triangularia setosa]